MGNTGGAGGVGGEFGSGSGGGGGREGLYGGHGGKGGRGCISESNVVFAGDLRDCEDTVFIWIKGSVDGNTFIEHVKKTGKIKTNTETAVRLAEIRQITPDITEGIVTYENVESVEKIQNIEFSFEGSVKIIPARNFLEKKDLSICNLSRKRGENIAWCFWRWQTNRHLLNDGQGGQSGKGGATFGGLLKGQNGEPGGCGLGSNGGKGGIGYGRL